MTKPDDDLVERVTQRIVDEGGSDSQGYATRFARAAIAECEKDWKQLEQEIIAAARVNRAFQVSFFDLATENKKLEAEAAAMRAALENLSEWCRQAGEKLGAVDGYDYDSGQEYAYRSACIEVKKQIALSPDAGKALLAVVEAAGNVRQCLHEEVMAEIAFNNALAMQECCIPDPRLGPKKRLSEAHNTLCSAVDLAALEKP